MTQILGYWLLASLSFGTIVALFSLVAKHDRKMDNTASPEMWSRDITYFRDRASTLKRSRQS